MICKICNFKTKSARGLSLHLRSHDLTILEYFLKYEDFKIPNCDCKKQCKFTKSINFRKTCGAKECIIKRFKNRKFSKEQIEHLRKKRYESLKKNRNIAWDNKSKGKLSYLENWFHENVIVKYKLYEKYDIVNEFAFYPYFIDFAFTNIKLAVEMDGGCHFKNGKERFEGDLKKDKTLINKGWKVFRIAYYEINEEKIKEFLTLLENLRDYRYEPKKLEDHLYKGKELKKYTTFKKICEFCKKEFITNDDKRICCCSSHTTKFIWHAKLLKLNNERIKNILNSNIDFSKFGWVTKAAKVLQMATQKVNKWMKKNMKDFYEQHCYKKYVPAARLDERLTTDQEVAGPNPVRDAKIKDIMLIVKARFYCDGR